MKVALGGEPAAGTAPRASPGRWWRWLLTLAVCALAWTWLLRHADLRALAAQAERLPPWAWLAAVAALMGGHGMRAVRLQRDWAHLHRVPWWQCLRVVLAHNAMIIMLPLRTGEASYLLWVRRQWGVGWGAAGLGLLRWRIQDAAVLLVLALALLLPLPLVPRLGVALLAGVALHLLVPPVWRWLQARSAPRAPEQGAWRGLGASASIWVLKVLANGGLLAALAGLPLETAWRAALGGELAGVQPLQPPAGLGVYEAGLWFAAGLPSDWTARVVSAALAVHAFSLCVALGAAALVQLAVPPLQRAEEVSG